MIARGEPPKRRGRNISNPNIQFYFNSQNFFTPSPPASTSGPVDSKDLPVDSFFSAGDPSDKKRLKLKLIMSPIF